MQLNPYLLYNGDCEAAFKFYEKALGGKIEAMLTHEGTPAAGQVPETFRNKILHARMTFNGQVLMASDAPPDRYEKPKGFSVTIGLTDIDEAERIYKALSAKATIQMPLQQTFWASRFAMFVDQFGIPWMINCGQPNT